MAEENLLLADPPPPTISDGGDSAFLHANSPSVDHLSKVPLEISKDAPLASHRWAFLDRRAGWWPTFLMLTIVGGFFRFWRLDRQAYWTDEISTIRRIKGTYDYLLSSLSDQGFPPGWYTLLRSWCLGVEHFFGPNAGAFGPASTRFLTAILGTCMVPVMYFLARQFTDRRGSFLVMLLAAVNPYLVYYSRDIKMYAAMWLFVTLNLAIFFRWQTTHRHLRWWWLFALTGALATSMQSMAWVVIGLQLLFLLTRPRLRALDGPLWIAGVGIMALLPTYWYLNRTNWVDRMVETGDGGLAWVDRYTDMGWKTIASLPTSHLLGFLWPIFPADAKIHGWFELGTDFDARLGTRSWPWVVHGELYASIGLLALLVIGLIPWRKMHRKPVISISAAPTNMTAGRWWWVVIWITVPTLVLALTWIPEESPWHARIWGHLTPTHIWEPRYLGIVLPAFVMWLAMSIRRLPFWPIRLIVAEVVIAISILSALSNHLLYRAAPMQIQGDIVADTLKRVPPPSVFIADPQIPFDHDQDILSIELAMHQRPTLQLQPPLPWENMRRMLRTPQQYASVASFVSKKESLQTLIMTDRYGDMLDPADPLSNESIQTRLGPSWALVGTVTYAWHYEWRFYLFHTWRTRVWERIAPPPPSPVRAAGKAAGTRNSK